MFGDDGRRSDDFHLLLHLGRILEKSNRAATIGTAIERVGDHLACLGRKRRSQVLLVAWLPAAFTLLAVFSRRLGRLDDIAGGRLGGSGRVLESRGQLAFECFVLLAKLCVFLPEVSVLCLQRRNPCRGRRQIRFHRRKTLRQRFARRNLARFPQDHGAVRYQSHAIQTRSSGLPQHQNCRQSLEMPDLTNYSRPATIIVAVKP